MPCLSERERERFSLLSILQASLSDQLRDVRKLIVSSEPAAIPLSEQLTAEERLNKLEKSHEHILQMLDELKRRVQQLEPKEQQQTPSAVRASQHSFAPAPEQLAFTQRRRSKVSLVF